VSLQEQTFEYGGYHFTPYRKFRGKSEKDFFAVSQKLRTDWELGLFSDKNRKGYRADYSYDDFYAASTDKECDIFRCVETGRLYVPGANELFGFTQSRNRERTDSR
jgi:hypothetical protein